MLKQSHTFFIFFTVYLIIYGCTERPRENPLDPNSNKNPDLTLSVLSYNQKVYLYWNQVNLTDFTGFNIYRRIEPDSPFVSIAQNLLPDRTNFEDNYVNYNTKYTYYITLVGETFESRPSNSLDITPGPGYNWIVDKWGYQIIKTTYDAQYKLLEYITGWRPEDLAIDSDNNKAVITYPTGGAIEIIGTLNGNFLNAYTESNYSFIDNPYLVEFDSTSNLFWISDSGGAVYTINSNDNTVRLINSAVVKPGEIFINQSQQIIYIIDEHIHSIYLFNFSGSIVDSISQIGTHQLINPVKLVMDENDGQFWLVERTDDKDYIYSGNFSNAQISLVDSAYFVLDLDFNTFDNAVWVSYYDNGNYGITQLSKQGIRQYALDGFYNVRQVTHNPFDGTLLITDSGNGRVIHYTKDFEPMGFFTNLNFPIRIEFEE